MPLDPGTVSGIMLGNLAANAIVGVFAPQLAQGIANGVCFYANSGLTVITVDAGTLGVGTGIGTGFVIPTPTLIGAFSTTFPSSVIIGISAPLLINAISIGMTESFASAIINTVNPTVGIGAGVVKAVPAPGASTVAFSSGFISAGLIGSHAALLAGAIANGLDIALSSGIGAVVIAGPASILPSSGAGFGKFS